MKRILALEAQVPTVQPEILAPNRTQQEPESPVAQPGRRILFLREAPDVGGQSKWLIAAGAARTDERCLNRKQAQTITKQRQPITSQQLHAKDELRLSI